MRPTVFLFSDPRAFPLYLVEKLLSNLCQVVVFSNDVKNWQIETSHISKTSSLVFDFQKNLKKYSRPDYFLMIDVFDQTLFSVLKAKGFVVVTEKSLWINAQNIPETVGVINVDNLFGPRMEINNKSRLSQIIGSAVRNDAIKIYENEKIPPVYMGDAVKLIVKWLFSFGPYGEVSSISSANVSVEDVCKEIKKVYPNFKYRVVRGEINTLPISKNVYLLEKSGNPLFEETLLWFTSNTQPESVTKNKKGKGRKMVGVLAVVIFILATPFIFIFIAIALLFFSKEMIVKENLNLGKFLAKASYITSNISESEFRIFTNIPVLGGPYASFKPFSYMVNKVSMVGLKSFDLISEAQVLSGGLTGRDEYDLSQTQDKIIANLNYLETTISLIESEAKNYPKLRKEINFDLIKKITSNVNKIVMTLSDLLGVDKNKTYLVLFQNNMELRPTGGFIGSFALVSFSAGKLGEVNVQDVYSADGQLKGHVEPPPPIKKYLKEANWFLRDSNWDFDFPTSAERAEWFLDKEIDVPVDGVIALDLNVVKDLLKQIGPIYLADYQTQVTADNFYEKTQTEVENNFFAGSTKKANFITALAKEIIKSLINNEISNINLTKIIYNNLEGRHIQVFLHNNLAKEAVANLDWDGAFNYQTCLGNCFSDFLGLIEANLGVNKSNYYIERKSNLSVDVSEDIIKKNLSVTYVNKADLAMGNRGIYKVYSRLVVPPNSEVGFVKVGDSQLQLDTQTVSGRKEIGYYFELPPGQTKTVNIYWEIKTPLSLNRAGEYLVYLRKQAGTPEEPISINVETTSGVALNVEPGYNTLFTKDINTKVTWKK